MIIKDLAFIQQYLFRTLFMAHHTTLKSNKKHLTLEELQLNKDVRHKINQLLEESTYFDALSQLNIPIDNKILLHGHTGCGKTATANAIGLALNKKVITINLSGFVSSRLGETARNLSDVFREASLDRAILFIDEFDFIGKMRDYDEKDSGEMKRLVNTLLQQIDHLPEHTLLICATNHIGIIDSALLRRFQIKLNYELPDKEGLDQYYDGILAQFPNEINQIERRYGISYAEAKDTAYQQIKATIIALEKNKRHKLFVYSPLRFLENQIRFRGQTLEGKTHRITHYKLVDSEEKGSAPFEKETLDTHQIAVKATPNDHVEGEVIEISGEDLVQLDSVRRSTHQRVQATSQSGETVWLYIAKKHF